MTACIRSFIVSLALAAALGAVQESPAVSSQEVRFESRLETQSDWHVSESASIISGTQQVKGLLTLLDPESKLNFPVPLQMKLEDVKFTVQENGKVTQLDIANPGNKMELVELKHWIGRPIRFELIDKEPFIQYSEDFVRQYGELQVFKNAFFEGLFVSDLHTLFSIVKRPLKEGETFQIETPKTDAHPFQQEQSFTVREITDTKIVIDVASSIERQKLTVPIKNADAELDLKAVIFGQFKGTWTIDRANNLLFSLKENGFFTQTMKVNEVEVSVKHNIDKQIATGNP